MQHGPQKEEESHGEKLCAKEHWNINGLWTVCVTRKRLIPFHSNRKRWISMAQMLWQLIHLPRIFPPLPLVPLNITPRQGNAQHFYNVCAIGAILTNGYGGYNKRRLCRIASGISNAIYSHHQSLSEASCVKSIRWFDHYRISIDSVIL